MEQQVEVQSCHLLEKDLAGEILWTWSYPKIDPNSRSVFMRKCTYLYQEGMTGTQPFHFFHFGKQWVYVYFSDVFSVDKLPRVKSVALILTTTDFHPTRYETLCRVLSKSYCKSGTPLQMLQLFLSVVAAGKCSTDENGTFYSAEFGLPNPFQNSQIANIVGRFGLETILIYTALLLKKRIVVYHHETCDLIKFMMSLPAFLPHRDMWNIIYPWIDIHPDEISPFVESRIHILGCTNSSIQNQVNLYDLYVNIPASEITVAPQAKEAMTMTKVHKDIAIFMVQITQKGFTESDIIHSINQKTKELIRNIPVGQPKDDKALETHDQSRKTDTSNAMQAFLLSLAQAESLTVI